MQKEGEMKVETTIIIVIYSLLIGMMYGCVGEWQPQYSIRYNIHVTSIIDGDTIDGILPNGNIERIRFLGIDTPETTADNNKPNEYDGILDLNCLTSWGIEAKYFTTIWTKEKDIFIEFDATAGFKTDKRWLAYIYLEDGTDFCSELLKQGYARAYMEGTCSQEQYYFILQQQAMNDSLGLWSCMPVLEGLSIVMVHYDALGNDESNLNDEYIIIKNNGYGGKSLSGWTLGDERNYRYMFPSGFFLAAGGSVTIHTGSGINTQQDVYWGNDSPVWNNDHDTAYLRDTSGALIDSWSW
jgi:micrococcal nuclease